MRRGLCIRSKITADMLIASPDHLISGSILIALVVIFLPSRAYLSNFCNGECSFEKDRS